MKLNITSTTTGRSKVYSVDSVVIKDGKITVVLADGSVMTISSTDGITYTLS